MPCSSACAFCGTLRLVGKRMVVLGCLAFRTFCRPAVYWQEFIPILQRDTGLGAPTHCYALQPGSTGTQGERESCSFLAWPSWLLVSGIALHSQTEN